MQLHFMRVALFAFFVAMLACANPATGTDLTDTFEDIVIGRASIEFPCPKSELNVVDLGGYAYRVSGCDAYATYECDYDDATGTNTDNWIYACDRAAQDGPSRLDASAE